MHMTYRVMVVITIEGRNRARLFFILAFGFVYVRLLATDYTRLP